MVGGRVQCVLMGLSSGTAGGSDEGDRRAPSEKPTATSREVAVAAAVEAVASVAGTAVARSAKDRQPVHRMTPSSPTETNSASSDTMPRSSTDGRRAAVATAPAWNDAACRRDGSGCGRGGGCAFGARGAKGVHGGGGWGRTWGGAVGVRVRVWSSGDAGLGRSRGEKQRWTGKGGGGGSSTPCRRLRTARSRPRRAASPAR